MAHASRILVSHERLCLLLFLSELLIMAGLSAGNMDLILLLIPFADLLRFSGDRP